MAQGPVPQTAPEWGEVEYLLAIPQLPVPAIYTEPNAPYPVPLTYALNGTNLSVIPLPLPFLWETEQLPQSMSEQQATKSKFQPIGTHAPPPLCLAYQPLGGLTVKFGTVLRKLIELLAFPPIVRWLDHNFFFIT
jgi:hypothetical protein